RCFFSPCGEKKSTVGGGSYGRRHRESSAGLHQVLPLLLLPLLLSPSADTARNRPMTVKIDRYCPTVACDSRNRPLRLISGGNGVETASISGTTW
ncbi:hypothetical protein BHE74_00032622, partial [Ensete ventricosum]